MMKKLKNEFTKIEKICLVSRPLPRCVAGDFFAIAGIAGEANGKPSAPRSRGLRFSDTR